MMQIESIVSLRRRLSLLVSLAAVLASTSAGAQPTPVPPERQKPAAAAPSVTPSQTTDPAAAEPTPAEEKVVLSSPSALGFVERLPSTAYPSDPIRGIYGGSLWRSFHGLQWPYSPKTGVGISGGAWSDTGFEHVDNGTPNEVSGAKYMIQQVRFVLRVTPTWSNGEYFAQGQVEVVGNNDQTQVYPNAASTDDAWVRFGRWNTWDVQVGRFQVWEIYHVGMGLDLFTQEYNGAVLQNENGAHPPSIYVVNDRPDLRSVAIGQAAVHVYPLKSLRFEFATQFGSTGLQNTVAARPVGIFDLGWLKLKAGATYEAQNDQSDVGKASKTSRGVGAAIQFVIDPYIEFGGNGSYGLVDRFQSDGSFDPANSNTTYSVGAFLNAQPLPKVVPDLLLGFGYDVTTFENQLTDTTVNRHGKFRQQQAFVAVQYYLWRQLFIKAVGGYAKADFAPTPLPPSPYSNEMLSARLRLEYLF